MADVGLKALGMDHGNPPCRAARCGSSPTSTSRSRPSEPLRVGDRVRVVPAHVDPTVTLHERLHVVRGDEVLDTWAVDLRGW